MSKEKKTTAGEPKAPEAGEPKAPAVKAGIPATGTVNVYCKLPNGIAIALPNGERVQLGGINQSEIIGAPGRTEVDASAWEEIKVLHKRSTWLKNGYVYAHVSADAADKDAADKTGLEGLSEEQLKARGIEKDTE